MPTWSSCRMATLAPIMVTATMRKRAASGGQAMGIGMTKRKNTPTRTDVTMPATIRIVSNLARTSNRSANFMKADMPRSSSGQMGAFEAPCWAGAQRLPPCRGRLFGRKLGLGRLDGPQEAIHLILAELADHPVQHPGLGRRAESRDLLEARRGDLDAALAEFLDHVADQGLGEAAPGDGGLAAGQHHRFAQFGRQALEPLLVH